MFTLTSFSHQAYRSPHTHTHTTTTLKDLLDILAMKDGSQAFILMSFMQVMTSVIRPTRSPVSVTARMR